MQNLLVKIENEGHIRPNDFKNPTFVYKFPRNFEKSCIVFTFWAVIFKNDHSFYNYFQNYS